VRVRGGVCVCMCVRVRVPASWSASSYMTMQMRKQFSVWTARQLLVCVCVCVSGCGVVCARCFRLLSGVVEWYACCFIISRGLHDSYARFEGVHGSVTVHCQCCYVRCLFLCYKIPTNHLHTRTHTGRT